MSGLLRGRGAAPLLAAVHIVVAAACGESTTGSNDTSPSDGGTTSAASTSATDGLAESTATVGSGSNVTGGAGGEVSMTPASSSDGGMSSSGGGGGETPAGDSGGSAGEATTTVTTTTGMVCSNGGVDSEFCLTREQMEEQARYGYELTPRDPPRTDEEIAAAWDDQGCLPAYWVGSSNCNPAVTPARRSGDQCCYTSCEGERCCGGGACGLPTTGSTGGP